MTSRYRKAVSDQRSTISAALALFAGALLLRLGHILALRSSPYFEHPIIDAETYHKAALAIAAGGGHPDTVFWQPPGYPYFLGFIYALFGPGPLAPRLVQALFGALSAVLTAWIGATLFGRWVGLAAGIGFACYGLLIYFDGELLTPSLTIALQLAAVALALRARDDPRRRWWGAAGLAGGLASLVTATSLVMVAAMSAFAKKRAHIVLLGAAIAIAPATIRNAVHGGEFVMISSNAGINLYIGNNPRYDETVGIRPGPKWQELGTEPARHGVSGAGAASTYFVRRVLDYLADDPVGFARLQIKKLGLLIAGNEIPRNQEIYPARAHSPVLRALLWKVPGLAFPFGLLLPLAAVGLAVAARRATLPAVLIAAYAVVAAAFFIAARYRAPLVPLLLVFAAEGARWFIADAGGRARALAIAGALAIFMAANINQGPMPSRMNADAEYNLAVQLEAKGRADEAMALYQSVLRQDPGYPEAWGNIGVLYATRGLTAEAEAAFTRVLDLTPNDTDAMVNLGTLNAKAGRREEAIGFFERALKVKPNNELARSNLAVLRGGPGAPGPAAAPNMRPPAAHDLTALVAGYERSGQLAKAIALLRSAAESAPADPAIRFTLGRILVKAGDRAGGLIELRRALSAGGAQVRSWVDRNPDLEVVKGELR